MTSAINNELGNHIRHFREHRKLAVEELASVARIPWAVLADIENGKHFPSLSQLERLLMALDTSWQELRSGFLP